MSFLVIGLFSFLFLALAFNIGDALSLVILTFLGLSLNLILGFLIAKLSSASSRWHFFTGLPAPCMLMILMLMGTAQKRMSMISFLGVLAPVLILLATVYPAYFFEKDRERRKI